MQKYRNKIKIEGGGLYNETNKLFVKFKEVNKDAEPPNNHIQF